MTIAWDTTYQHISLYVAYVHNISLSAPVDKLGNSQRQLQSEPGYELSVVFSLTNEYLANTPTNSSDTFPWVASCAPDCNSPYQFHIVNSRGTSYQVTQEGFWSDYFWIRASSRPATETSTATSATSSSATSMTTSSSATSSTDSTTSTQAPPNPVKSTNETMSPSPSPVETVSPPPSSPAETESSESGLSTGVTVGISIAAAAIVLCTIGLGVFYCAMKRSLGEKRVPRYEGDNEGLPTCYAMTQHTNSQSTAGTKLTELDTVQPVNHTPTAELAATQSPSELGPRWH
jgi:hypothetical protein